MAGIGGGGSGSKGGDNNEERLRKMVADHLRVSELFAIDTRTREGLASLTAILGQALQAGLTTGEAQREEEARKAVEAKAAEKKKKRDERATTGALSPRTLKKKRRKDERDAIRKEKLNLKKKEEERKKLPLITLAEQGILTELAYTGAKSTIRHIVSTNFARGIEWGTLSKAKQKRVINEVKGAFRNGGELDSQWIADKISNSMSQARYHDRMKILVDEVGDPPLKFLKAVERVKLVPPTTHRLGQGGIPGLKTTFASEGESESSQGSSDEEERGISTAPSATTSSGPSSFASRNVGSTGGKDKKDREEDEEEGQGDDDEREEDEQPPPPPKNTRKKHSRKKSKKGRKSR
ncbi:unnamed protein product [Sphagnum balticum]